MNTKTDQQTDLYRSTNTKTTRPPDRPMQTNWHKDRQTGPPDRPIQTNWHKDRQAYRDQ